MLRLGSLLLLALSVLSCGGDTTRETPAAVGYHCVNLPRPVRPLGLQLTRVAAGFKLPLLLLPAPGDSRLFVVEKGGRLMNWEGDGPARVFVDLSTRVDASPNEGGLLGAAFHPQFEKNGQVFLSFTDRPPGQGLRSVVARYESKDGGKTLDPTTEVIVFTQPQPFGNHNGGMISFGPDALLYIGLGDGGSAGDPLGSGQDLNSLLGKMLRIDVDGGEPYAIPADNPFAQGGGRPEIFAWGLRNPWRFSFDRATGELWVGDVGQDKYEEIDLVRKGGNYGWNTMEGAHCFSPESGCNQGGLELPIVEYPHSEGVSVTGGYVYRGKAIPELVGSYLYGDFDSGRLWRVRRDQAEEQPSAELLLETGLPIASFGEDNEGEVYLVAINQGEIYKITPNGPRGATPFPQKLSETGCVDPADPTRPAAALVPYEVNAPLWSDGAEKKRWFALPGGTSIQIDAEGDMELPVGSTTIKEFSIGGRRVETRLFVRHEDGGWAGYTYEWDEDGKDATLLSGSKRKTIDGQAWHYPSGAECVACHTSAAGRTLGLELAQLNRTDAGGKEQLDRLASLGLFASALPEQRPRLAAPAGPESLDARARSYLHSNCSFCHRPAGTGRGPADFRFSVPFAEVGVCGVEPQQGDLGVPGVRLLAPGDPANSVLSLRMHRRDAKAMPPVATSLVDMEGTALVDAWISSLSSCP